MADPLRVEITRGSTVESVHDVDVVVVDSSGSFLFEAGDPHRGVMPRSSLKPIQALPLITTGAADAFSLSDRELALACSSHNGEPGHITTVLAVLDRIGLSVEDLECGPQVPSFGPAADDLVVNGIEADARYNNCSGKHSGFLAVCRHLGIDPVGYIGSHHRLQTEHINPAIEQSCEVSLQGEPDGIDGCGIPVWEIPLDALARGWSNLASDPAGIRLVTAMAANPWYVAGTGRSDTDIMTRAQSPVATKGGAEGVHCAVVLSDGTALAAKARDGAERAVVAATRSVLDQLGIVASDPSLITNRAGRVVGEIRVASH